MPRLLLLLLLSQLLAACAAPVVVGGAAAGGAAVAHDRRSTGTMVDDEGIELKALNAIGNDAQLSEQCHINVTSFNGIVLLTGEAPTGALRDQVLRLARKQPKVRRVLNEITLAKPSPLSRRAKDSWLTAKVKTKLLGADGLDGTRIKVVSENGTVFLMGLVTRDEAATAVKVTKQTDGVTRVVRAFEYTR